MNLKVDYNIHTIYEFPYEAVFEMSVYSVQLIPGINSMLLMPGIN